MQVKEINGIRYVHVYSSEDAKGREVKHYIKEDNIAVDSKFKKRDNKYATPK